uniref:Candidate secreted effector n=1 Tax=Meloidogyne incognita TaxID=6306 RepID=A0A914MES3_MELIC
MSIDFNFPFEPLLHFKVILWITNFSNSTIWTCWIIIFFRIIHFRNFILTFVMPTILFDMSLLSTELALHLFKQPLSFWFPFFSLLFHFFRWLFIVSFHQIHFYSRFSQQCWFFSNQYCLRFVGQMQSILFNDVLENHWHCLLLFGFDKSHS